MVEAFSIYGSPRNADKEESTFNSDIHVHRVQRKLDVTLSPKRLVAASEWKRHCKFFGNVSAIGTITSLLTSTLHASKVKFVQSSNVSARIQNVQHPAM